MCEIAYFFYYYQSQQKPPVSYSRVVFFSLSLSEVAEDQRIFPWRVFGSDPGSWWRKCWSIEFLHPRTYTSSGCNTQTHTQSNRYTWAYSRLQRTQDSWSIRKRSENRRWQEATGPHGCCTKSLCLSKYAKPEEVSLIHSLCNFAF